jgi:hypothetical protein
MAKSKSTKSRTPPHEPVTMTAPSNDIEKLREQLENVSHVAQSFDDNLSDLTALGTLIYQMMNHYEDESAYCSQGLQVLLNYQHWLQRDYEKHTRALYLAIGFKGAADCIPGGAS